ncbi:hypothetical protein F5X96DRAFT_664552 [Biscogniauxia mediterranea]|nr:hypothetical protein F5X96DRAFT_664552 [Biscogniauxia mediterranea]
MGWDGEEVCDQVHVVWIEVLRLSMLFLSLGTLLSPLLPSYFICVMQKPVGWAGRVCEGAGVSERIIGFICLGGFFLPPFRWRFGSLFLSLGSTSPPSLDIIIIDLWFIQLVGLSCCVFRLSAQWRGSSKRGLGKIGGFLLVDFFFLFTLCFAMW